MQGLPSPRYPVPGQTTFSFYSLRISAPELGVKAKRNPGPLSRLIWGGEEGFFEEEGEELRLKRGAAHPFPSLPIPVVCRESNCMVGILVDALFVGEQGKGFQGQPFRETHS